MRKVGQWQGSRSNLLEAHKPGEGGRTATWQPLPTPAAPARPQYVPAAERRVLFEEFCKEVAASRHKAGAGGAKPSGRAAAGRGGSSAAARSAAAAEGSGAQQSAQAAFEALLDEIQEVCRPPPEEGEAGAAERGGGSSGGEPPALWDERLTLAQLEPHWGVDPRWRGCGAEARERLFAARMARLRDAAQKEAEEGFRWVWRGKWVWQQKGSPAANGPGGEGCRLVWPGLGPEGQAVQSRQQARSASAGWLLHCPASPHLSPPRPASAGRC